MYANSCGSHFLEYSIDSNKIQMSRLDTGQICIRLEDTGNGSVTINGGELSPGMYMYTLIVDGKEVDIRKMILTE